MLHNVEVVQNQSLGCRLQFFSVDVSEVSAIAAGPDGLLEGTYLADVFKSATGVYQITLKRASARTPIVVGINSIGTVDVRFAVTELDEDTIEVTSEVGGTDTDVDFHLVLAVFDDQDQK